MKVVVEAKKKAKSLIVAFVVFLGVGISLALFVIPPGTVSASDANTALHNLIDEIKSTGKSLGQTPGDEVLKGKMLNLLGQAPPLFSKVDPQQAEGLYGDLIGALAESVADGVKVIFPSLSEREALDEKMTRITEAAVERTCTVSFADADAMLTDAQVKEAVQRTVDVTKGLNELSHTLPFGLQVKRTLSIEHKGTAITFSEKVLKDNLGEGTAAAGMNTMVLGLDNGIKVRLTLPAAISKTFTLQVEPVNGIKTDPLKSVGIAPFSVNVIVDGKKMNSQVFPMTVSVGLSASANANANGTGGLDPQNLAAWNWQAQGNKWVSKKGVFDKETSTLTFEARDLGVFAILYAAPQFKDMTAFPWAKSAVEEMAAKGVISGIGPGVYSPNERLTRAQLARLLVKALLPEKVASVGNAGNQLPFTDLKSGAWYAQDVAVAYEYGIIKGVSTTSFAPDEMVTREQMIAMVTRALRVDHAVWVKDSKKTLASYKDASKISSWAQESVAIATEQGILSGSGSSPSNRVMDPTGTVSRAMGAVITSSCYHWKQ